MKYALSFLSPQKNLTPTLSTTFLQTFLDACPAQTYDISQTTWLSDKEAYQVILKPHNPMPSLSPEFGDIVRKMRKTYSNQQIDINLIPFQTHLRKHLLIADMDSTIVTSETLDDLAAALGIGPAVADITAKAMQGEIDFKEAVRARVAMLANLPDSTIQTTISDLVYTSGAKTLVQTMRKFNAHTALVSGGFQHFSRHVAEKVGFHEHHANQLEVKNQLLTGKVIEPIQDKDSKSQILHQLAQTHNIDLDACLTVGDGANDIPMLMRANQANGLGVGYHAKQTVKAQILPQIQFHDLTALLFLQGYHREEFVADSA